MSRLAKNVLYNLLGQGLVLVLGFVAVKYVFRQLGEDALGIIYFTITFSGVLYAVLEMGIGFTATREVSAHFEDEPGYIHDFIRTASLLHWVAYSLLAVALYLAAPVLVEKWVNLKTMDVPTATRMVQVLGIGTLTVLPRSLYGGLLRGLQRMGLNNFIDVATVGLQQIGTSLILISGGGLFHVVYWLTLSFGLGLLGYFFASVHFFSFRAIVPGYSAAVVQRNLSYSSNMAAISMLATVHLQADKVIISKLLPIGMFGFYGFAFSIVSKLTLVTSAIAQAAFPSFSSLFQIRDRDSLRVQYRKLHDLLCFATLPILAAVPFASLPLFSYLFNSEIAHILFVPVALLCIGTYMNSTLHVPYVFSLAVGKPEIAVKANFYALFVVLPVAALLIYWFGLVGAGLSWVVYHLFAYAYAVPRICSECLEIPTAEWYRHILRIGGLGSGTYGLAWAILESVSTHSILFIALAYAGASMGFLIGAYLMMGNELRQTIAGSLRTLSLKLGEALIPGMNAKGG